MSKQTWYTMQATDNAAEISIYDEIGFWGVTAKAFLRDLQALGPVETITLRLNSGGGDVLDGFAIFNALRRHEGKIIAHIDGIAASMASIIACAADEIHIAENAWFMIHNPATVAFGEADDLRTMADVMDGMKAHAIAAYQRHVDEDTDVISGWMDAETWMTGADATGLGWRMQVGEELKAVAQLRAPRFTVPEDAADFFSQAATEPEPPKPATLEMLAKEYECVGQLALKLETLTAEAAAAAEAATATIADLEAKAEAADAERATLAASCQDLEARLKRAAGGQNTPAPEPEKPADFRAALALCADDPDPYIAARKRYPEVFAAAITPR